MERTSDYWFMIEPYVHINIANGYMLLYNTLDKETIISNCIIIIINCTG